LAVNFTLESDQEGILLLEYQNSSGGDADTFFCIKDLKVSPTPRSIDFDPVNNLITVKTEPNLTSTIQYLVVQYFEGTLLNKEVIIPHHKGTINTIPNSDLTWETYWSNYAVYEKLPYIRALLYTFLIDTQIKE
jgi:hypothetical protein